MRLISKVEVVVGLEIAQTGFRTACSSREPLGTFLKIKIMVKVSHMVIMTHPEPFMLYKPKWAILCYHELCRAVCPSRKWNLPSADQFPSYTHRLLASNVWSINHPFRDWHPPPGIFSPAIIHPKSPTYTQSSHTRSSHHETPKLLESFQQKREGIILKKRVENERRKSHSPKELQTRSSNKKIKFPS